MAERDPDLTITVRALELGYYLAQGRQFTVTELAGFLGMSLSGAYRLLCRASASRRVPLAEERGQWFVAEGARDGESL